MLTWADDLLHRMPPARRQRWQLATAQLLALARDGRPRRVLDAGCGDGLLTLDLAERLPHWSFVGVDRSYAATAAAECDRRRRGLGNAAFACLDVTRLAVGEPFDVVLALECLLEIPDDRAALAQLTRALHPQGLLLAHVPARDWRPVLPGAETTWRHEVRHGYDQGSLQTLLTEGGLRMRVLRPTQRDLVTVAQEVRDRWKRTPRRLVPLAPLMAAAARLDSAGLTWGPARGWFLTAARSAAPGAPPAAAAVPTTAA